MSADSFCTPVDGASISIEEVPLPPSSLDLTTPEDLAKTLENTPYASEETQLISGGNTNYTYVATLKFPFAEPLAPEDERVIKKVVLKHAEPFSRTAREFALSLQRSQLEYLLLSHLDLKVTVGSVTVTTPRAFEYFPPTNTSVIQHIGNSTTIKAALLEESIPLTIANTLGRALARYSLELYSWSRDSSQAALRNKVSAVEWSKEISFAVTYGHILQVADLYPSILNPHRDAMKKLFERAKKDYFEENEEWGMIHGDYWTGNVLVPKSFPEEGAQVKMYILDWEVTKISLPCFDIGQMLAELYLPVLFNDKLAGQAIIDGLCEELMGSEYMEIDGFREGVAAHFGVHLLVWPYKMGWDKERLEECLKLGGEFIQRSVDVDLEWLKGSCLGALFSERTGA